MKNVYFIGILFVLVLGLGALLQLQNEKTQARLDDLEQRVSFMESEIKIDNPNENVNSRIDAIQNAIINTVQATQKSENFDDYKVLLKEIFGIK